jgi:hypothetical protein
VHTIAMIIPLLVGVWVFLDAKSRGKDLSGAMLWGIGTFLLLIIVLPLWLLLRPPIGGASSPNKYSKAKAQNFRSEEPKLFCTQCQKSIEGLEGALFCPYCGQRLSHSSSPITIEADHNE